MTEVNGKGRTHTAIREIQEAIKEQLWVSYGYNTNGVKSRRRVIIDSQPTRGGFGSSSVSNSTTIPRWG